MAATRTKIRATKRFEIHEKKRSEERFFHSLRPEAYELWLLRVAYVS